MSDTTNAPQFEEIASTTIDQVECDVSLGRLTETAEDGTDHAFHQIVVTDANGDETVHKGPSADEVRAAAQEQLTQIAAAKLAGDLDRLG